jgi:hypothetical protein
LSDEEQEQRGEPSVEEVVKQIQIGQFLLSTVSTLASLAYAKLDAGEREQARLAIEALRALTPVLRGHVDDDARRDIENAVANLQVAYADAASQS